MSHNLGQKRVLSEIMKHAPSPSASQQDRLLDYLHDNEIARAFELREIGVSATAISRAVKAGDAIRIGLGLYQATDVEADLNTKLAEVAKRAPHSAICLPSALALHALTDWISPGFVDSYGCVFRATPSRKHPTITN